MQSVGAIGDKPLVVIVHGEKVMFRNQLGLSADDAERMEQVWLQLQKQTLTLSSESTLVTAKNSGHLVHQDEPELIIEAVKNLYEN